MHLGKYVCINLNHCPHLATLMVSIQEYPTEPLDKKPALQAEFELAGKKNLGKLAGWEI